MKQNLLFRRLSGLLTAAGLAGILAGCAGSVRAPLPPVITEAMNRNRTVLCDASGTYQDWIELHNPGAEPLSLAGYTLSDSEKSPRKWEFPAETRIEAGGYLVVYCSGAAEHAGSELHASFRISSDGEPVLLSDPAGKIVSRLDIPALPEDVSCGIRADGTEDVVFYQQPTPGRANGSDGLDSLEQMHHETFDLRISEYTTSNSYQFYDHDGDCPTWAEIENFGSEPVNLGGMYLSDDDENPNKWQFPRDLILEPGAFQLVLLSGKDRFSGGELHADFSLSARDRVLVLSDQTQRPIDRVELQALEGGVSCGRTPDDPAVWAYFARPTPGAANCTQAFDSLRAGTALPVRGVWINEVMAVSGRPEFCTYDRDWVELYNGSAAPVDLSGYHLTDSAADPTRYALPPVVLEPGAFLLLYADGQPPTEAQPDHMPFRLSAAGETLRLMRPDGTLCDRFDTGRQQNGLSSGRGDGPGDSRLFFYEPTPGAPNGAGLPGYTPLPVFSADDLYLEAGTAVTLSGGSEIRYTTDGSVPTRESPRYDSPIPITENTTLRAAVFDDGLHCGGVSTHTYVVDAPHDIAVACVSTRDDNLFGPNGIYSFGSYYNPEFPYFGANFWADREIPIHFEFYETDGAPAVSFDAGLRIFGQFSRGFDQKSVSVHLREAYGPTQVRYPFFPGSPVTEYHDLLLRTSGQDWNASKLRDPLAHMVVRDMTDIDLMDYRPVALYLNGEYWGLYNLRDKVNEQYLATHRGIDPDQVDVIKGDSFAQSGDTQAYDALMQDLRSRDYTGDEAFRDLCTRVDAEEIMDYWITEIFFSNTDTGNIKIYKERSPDAKWRLILYDLDWGLFRTTYHWDMLAQALDPRGHGIGNYFSTRLLRALVASDAGEQMFLERWSYHLRNTFAPERTCRILREMADAIATEIPRQAQRWGVPSPKFWASEIDFLEQAMVERQRECREDLQNWFGLTQAQMDTYFPDP